MPVAKGQAGVRQEMHKFKAGQLHSGSASGPVVKSRAQAIAISLHEAGLGRTGNRAQRGKNPGHHGGFAMGKSKLVGGPPAAGFHARGSAQPPAKPRAQRKPTPDPSPAFQHLGRFATGKQRPGVSRSTTVPAPANSFEAGAPSEMQMALDRAVARGAARSAVKGQF